MASFVAFDQSNWSMGVIEPGVRRPGPMLAESR